MVAMITLSHAQTANEDLLSGESNQPVVSGFYNRINVGVLGGSNSSPSFNIINGYRFNQHWSVGLGLGVEQFFWNRYIPTFVEGNYNLLKSPTTPWLSVMAGYEVPFENFNTVKGGITCGGKIGFSYFIAKHVGISTSIGYRYAHLTIENNWWDDFVTVSHLNRFEFRVGVVFK